MTDYQTVDRADVQVSQVVNTVVATARTAQLIPVAVGPCYQIVEAQTSAGAMNSEALTGSYTNYKRQIKSYDFPDPRSNNAYLSFVSASTRAFVASGTTIKEVKDSETKLCGNVWTAATSVRAIGTSTTSRQIKITGGTPAPTFTTSPATGAVITGTADISAGKAVNGLTLYMIVCGFYVPVTFSGVNPISSANILAQINAAFVAAGGVGTLATAPGPGNLLTLTAPVTPDPKLAPGFESFINIISTSTALVLLGLDLAANQKARGTAHPPVAGDELWVDGNFIGNIVTIDGADTVTIDEDVIVHPITGALDGKYWWIVAKNLATPRTSSRPNPALYKYPAATAASILGTVDLTVAHDFTPAETFKFTVDGGTELTTTLSGLLDVAAIVTAINTTYGATLASNSAGKVLLTSPTTGNTSRIDIGTGSANATLGFTAAAYNEGVSIGDLMLCAEHLWDAYTGVSFSITNNSYLNNGAVYIQYKALRKDVTVLASNPELVSSNDSTEMEELIGPFTTENPLGLAALAMLTAAPGMAVSLFGVDSVSSNAEGDRSAYLRALSFLKSREAYALAPLTYQEEVHSDFNSHCTAMSVKTVGRERICYITPEKPTRHASTIVGSGTDGNSGAAGYLDVEDDLAALLLAAGVPNPGSMPLSGNYHCYVIFEGDTNRYNIVDVVGHRMHCNVTFTVGQNTDGFYATSVWPATYISKSWTVYLRGLAISLISGIPDYTNIAVAYQNSAERYANRRTRQLVPEECAMVDGESLEVRTEGYYAAAACAAQLCYQQPQQGKTNMPLTGITRLYGANDYFGGDDLKIIGYNNYLLVQEPIGTGAVVRWHQATTDPTSDDTREESITTCLDYGAKIIRTGLRRFIGLTNITDNFEMLLNQSLQALIAYVVTSGAWLAGEIKSIARITGSKTGVRVRIRVRLPYPCNLIDVEIYTT